MATIRYEVNSPDGTVDVDDDVVLAEYKRGGVPAVCFLLQAAIDDDVRCNVVAVLGADVLAEVLEGIRL